MDEIKDPSVCKGCGAIGNDLKLRMGSTSLLCENCIGIFLNVLDIEKAQATKTDLVSSSEHDATICSDPSTPLKHKCTNCILDFFLKDCGCNAKLRTKVCTFCKCEQSENSAHNDLPQLRLGSKLPICKICVKRYLKKLKELKEKDIVCDEEMAECAQNPSNNWAKHYCEFFEEKTGVLRAAANKNFQNDVSHLDPCSIPVDAVFSHFKRNDGTEVLVVVGDKLGEPGMHGAAFSCLREGRPAAVKFFFRRDDWFKEVCMVKKMKQAGITNAYIDTHDDLPLGYTMVLYGNSILKYLKARPVGHSFPYLTSASFCYKMTVILEKFSSNNLCHRDIGESNVCLAKDDVTLWLIDFTDSKEVMADDAQKIILMKGDYKMFKDLFKAVAYGHNNLVGIIDDVQIDQFDMKTAFPYKGLFTKLNGIQFYKSAKLQFDQFVKITKE